MDIQRADPGGRRQAIVILLIVALGGCLAMLAMRRWLAGLDALPPAEAIDQALVVLRLTLGASAVSLAILGAYLWRLGQKIMAAGRFPLPGTPVIRDTLILAGAAAGQRGRVLQGFAVIAMLAAALVVVAAWRLVQVFAPAVT